MAREIDPDVVVTIEDVQTTNGGLMTHYAAGKTPLSWRRLITRRGDAASQDADATFASVACRTAPRDDDYRPVSRAA
jgi:hypothetical protein